MQKEVWVVINETSNQLVGVFTTRDLAIEASSYVIAATKDECMVDMRVIELNKKQIK